MARRASVEWRAVGASLETLAQTMRTAALDTPKALAYANSGVLQQAGVVLESRYVVAGRWMRLTRSGYANYTAPPGVTHGPVVLSWKDELGQPYRNAAGQFVRKPLEKRLFIRGKFVDRSGGLLGAAQDLRAAGPTERLGVVIADGMTGQQGKRGEVTVGIDPRGEGFVDLRDGYAAAEKGSRNARSGVRGWWRSIRSASSRWSTMIRKKYPELLALRRTR